MSDNDHDVLETGDLDADAGLEDFDTGGKQTFGDAWKTNPMVKIGVVVGGLAILVGGFMMFGGKSNPIAPSVVAGGDKGALKEAPGGKVSDLYAKAVTETNEAAVDQALKTGTSAITTPIGPSKGKVEVEGSKESAEDPLERWRRIQEERTKKEQQAKVEPANTPPPAAPVDPYANQKQQMAQSMAQQMQSILQAQDLKEPKTKEVTPPGWLMQKYKEDLQNAKDLQEAINDATGATAAGANNAVNQTPVEILIEPGKIEYAQLVIEANSDTPGPVLAELASGPLVGDRMIGSFQKMDEFLVLKFDTVVVDGIGLSTEAIALDPETSRPSLVTEVDHKYFKRVILPAAAAFISGIGGAIATSGSTTVAAGQGTVTTAQNDLNSKQEFFKGVEKASDKFGEVLNQDAQNVQVQVRVAAGTHIGVLFTKAVNKNPPGGPVMATTISGSSTPPAAQQQPIFLQLAPQTAAQGQTAATATTATPVTATKQ